MAVFTAPCVIRDDTFFFGCSQFFLHRVRKEGLKGVVCRLLLRLPFGGRASFKFHDVRPAL